MDFLPISWDFRSEIEGNFRLTDAQARALKRLAADRGVPVASLIRESVDLLVRTAGTVDEGEQRRRAIAAAGRFRSGRQDLASDHDSYLPDAYAK